MTTAIFISLIPDPGPNQHSTTTTTTTTTGRPQARADDGNDDEDPTLPETLLPFILLAGVVILVLLAFLLLSVVISRRAARALARGQSIDPESHAESVVLQRLESLIPAKTYKTVVAETARLMKPSCDQEDGNGSSSVVICVICLDKLVPKSIVRFLPCHHIFHAACIDQWFLKGHYTCPICIGTYYSPP